MARKQTPIQKLCKATLRLARKNEDGINGLEPCDFADPYQRAMVVFSQWHFDGDREILDEKALDYAKRLIQRLEEDGLAIVVVSHTHTPGIEDDPID